MNSVTSPEEDIIKSGDLDKMKEALNHLNSIASLSDEAFEKVSVFINSNANAICDFKLVPSATRANEFTLSFEPSKILLDFINKEGK